MQENHRQTVLSIIAALGLSITIEEDLPPDFDYNNPLSCKTRGGTHVVVDLIPKAERAKYTEEDGALACPKGYPGISVFSIGEDAPVELWLFSTNFDVSDHYRELAYRLGNFLEEGEG